MPLLTLGEMTLRLTIALVLGGLMGLERELIGKQAGIRTAMLVSAGASIYTMISIDMPNILHLAPGAPVLSDRIISNIVVGIGFLGAGIIIKTGEQVKGLTTAALIWATAAVGTLVGLQLFSFAAVSALLMSGTLYFLRKGKLYERVHKLHPANGENGD